MPSKRHYGYNQMKKKITLSLYHSRNYWLRKSMSLTFKNNLLNTVDLMLLY